MAQLFDSLILIVSGLILSSSENANSVILSCLQGALIYAALLNLLSGKPRLTLPLNLLFQGLFFAFPMLFPYFSICIYHLSANKSSAYQSIPGFLAAFWILFHPVTSVMGYTPNPAVVGLSFALVIPAYMLGKREFALRSLEKQIHQSQDALRENIERNESNTRSLLSRQGDTIRLTLLEERNRIARDMHDSIGHVLSSSLLQTGALQTVNHDPVVGAGLNQLQATLESGVSQARDSIYALRDQGQDLESDLRALCGRFHFCPLDFLCHIDNEPSAAIAEAMMAIVTEALTNTLKHSRALRVKVALREFPAFYQLKIEDTVGRTDGLGTASTPDSLGLLPGEKKGMGLSGMCERVGALHGEIHFHRRQGFGILIIIPKSAKSQN